MKRQPVSAGKLRRRGILLSVLAAVCVISVILAAVSDSFVCYAVAYDGEVVGTVASRTDLDAAIEEADAVAAMILGEEHPVYGGVSVSATLSSGAGSAEDLTGALLGSVEGITLRPFLTVDGQTVAAMDSEDAIEAVLQGILDRYSDENTVSAAFTQKAEIVTSYISDALLTDAAELARMLDPENADSPWALTVVTHESLESTEILPYEEVVTYDENAWSDEITVTQEGAEGQRLNTYTLVLENGAEVSRYLSQSAILAKPVNREVTIGAIPGSRTDSTGTYIWPTTGVITSPFGAREISIGSTNHRGVDIGNKVGTDVWAADGGTVIYAQDSKGSYGNFIKIQHDNGVVTCYAHLSEILVSVGDKVAQGDVIAKMGATGRVTGPHLHFEIRPDGVNAVNPVNSKKYLSGKPQR